MNKYLRTWLLGSNIAWLRNIGTRSVRKTHARRHAAHQKAIFEALYPAGGHPRVLNGPFAGMVYLNESVWGSITPRWIGSYESCLWPVLNEIITSGYERVVDVGCAEGYYAAGLARVLPEADIRAYDLDPDSRKQALKLWDLNGRPGRLTVGGLLDHQELGRLALPGRSLLICDIEGGEMSLLDPAACPALTGMDILVEVHQTAASVEDNAATLRQRFEPTHQVEVIRDSSRATAFEGVSALDAARLKKATSEGRPYEQVWLWMKCPRAETAHQ